MQDYSIGVDIGTGSEGWAVIDKDYKLAKLKGKDAWGVLLFDDAKTAVNRRLKRSQRRRYERRRERIRLLQELMNDLVLNVDNSFYIRLKESYLRSDLLDTSYKRSNYYNLFEGEYTDKDYYKDFKTIYHLREYLINTTEKADIRLVYLALHHIVKYRGNFLYEGRKIDSSSSMLQDSLSELFVAIEDKLEINNNYVLLVPEIVAVLKDKTISKTWKIDRLKTILNDKENKKFYQGMINIILGNTANLADIFNNQNLVDENDKPIKIAFSKNDYDANEDLYLSLAGDSANILIILKSIYTAILFEKVTNGQSNISKAMISKYDKHNKDLKIFKSLMKSGFPIEINPKTNKPFYTEYSKMFRSAKGINYVNYIGSVTSNCHYDKRVSKDAFYDNVKKILAVLPYSVEKEYCLNQIELDDFLPLINTVENSTIPYQMNKSEMVAILDNQSVFYPQLKEIKDKILSILEFKRPYYVGTLKGKFSWCEQIIDERITPWNFNDLVNTDELAEKFIVRMTNYCNIFKDEPTLPLNSIIYQAYVTLNELNKIKFKDKTISLEWKQLIFKNLCLKYKTVKTKLIAKELSKNYNIVIAEKDITGLSDDQLNGTMGTFIDFSTKLTSFDMKNLSSYEEAIRIITIFNDEKIKKKRIEKLDIFSADEIKLLCKMRYSGWGKYSNKLLNDIQSKEHKTILQTMYDSDKNINQLLFDKDLGFAELIAKPVEHIEDFNYERDIENLYCSPSVKKAVWNALKIVEEIVDIANCPPSRIFLEDTHEIAEKKKTDSRIKHLSELYKLIVKEEYFNKDTHSLITEYNHDNKKIDNDKLYLWLLQLGRCMYSGEIIPFDQLKECEIDHIVPRSYIKDDSFENRVLVKKLENQYKTDTLSISPLIKEKMASFWNFLAKHKFIGSKKLTNLTRGEYSESEKVGFINRQLVETSQIIKEVRDILSKRYPSATIQGIRAGLTSNFRYKYSYEGKAGFFKIRQLNNLHHAKDAYLTAVLGQFTTVACPLWGQDKLNRAYNYYIANNEQSKDDVATLVNKRYGLILDLMQYGDLDKFELSEDGEYLWDNQRYMNIFKMMEKNTCLIVKKKLYYANSDFYKQTIYSPLTGKNLLPLKSKKGEDMPSNIYGGYSEEHPAYFLIVKYDKVDKKKTETKYALSRIPLLTEMQNLKDNSVIDNYIKTKFGDTAVIIRKIFNNQLINFDGHLCYVTGEGEINNAVELFVDPKFEKLLYMIEKDSIRIIKDKQTTSQQIKDEQALSQQIKDEAISQQIKEFIIHYNYKIRKHMPLFANFADKLDNILAEFYNDMTIESKIKLVKEMLVVSKSGAGRFDLDKQLGGGTFGRLSKTIYPDKVEWIDNSYTGIYSFKRRY